MPELAQSESPARHFVPGLGQPFSVTALPGESLSFATMIVQSNDAVIGLADTGLSLFDDEDSPVPGSIDTCGWDAGTEEDEPFGFGEHQTPHQAGPKGMDEEVDVMMEDLHTGMLVRVTIEPME